VSPRPETFYRYAGEIADDLDTPILVSMEIAPPVCSRDEAQRLETFAPPDTLYPMIRLLRSGLKSVHVAGISGDVARDAILLSLARALAETGRRILVIDADSDGPPLAEVGRKGLTDLMDMSEPLGRVIVHSPGYDGMMAFLPLGTRPGSLESPGAVDPLIRVLDELRPSYDVILVSAPCLDRRGKVHPAATASEGVLLVLSAGVISRDRIRRNFLQLWGVEAPIQGLVTLGVPAVLPHVVSSGRVEAAPAAVAYGGRVDEDRPLVAPDSLSSISRAPLVPSHWTNEGERLPADDLGESSDEDDLFTSGFDLESDTDAGELDAEVAPREADLHDDDDEPDVAELDSGDDDPDENLTESSYLLIDADSPPDSATPSGLRPDARHTTAGIEGGDPPDRYDVYMDEGDVSSLLDLQADGEIELSDLAAAAAGMPPLSRAGFEPSGSSGVGEPGDREDEDEDEDADELPISLAAEEDGGPSFLLTDDEEETTGEPELGSPAQQQAGISYLGSSAETSSDEDEDDLDTYGDHQDEVAPREPAFHGVAPPPDEEAAEDRKERMTRLVLWAASGVGLVALVVMALSQLIGGDDESGGLEDALRASRVEAPAKEPPADLSDEVVVTADNSGQGLETHEVMEEPVDPPVRTSSPAGSPPAEDASSREGTPGESSPATNPAAEHERPSVAKPPNPAGESEATREVVHDAPREIAPAVAGGVPTMRSDRFRGQAPFYAVHITSFRTMDRADTDAERLGRVSGLPAEILEVTIESGEKKGLWYRVIVGHFPDLGAARAAAETIRRKGVADYARVYRITG
jgi:Mrp family chromosome partitioning ATPase